MQKKIGAKHLAVLALFCALVCAGKLALDWLPNIEVVTLFVAVAATTFGGSFAATVALVFCLEQTLIFGFNTWVISYVVHFLVVAVVFCLLPKKSNVAVYCVAAGVLTFFFGVLTSVVDTFLAFDGSFIVVFSDFFQRFAIMYARGIVFFAIHIVSNIVVFALAFVPLKKLTNRLRLKMFGDEMEKKLFD